MNAISVEAFADGWAAALWRASWQGGIAVALVWITCAIAPSIPPRIRCWLWRLAAVKLILGLIWISAIPVAVLAPEVQAQAPIAAPSPVQLIALPPVENFSGMPLLRANDPIAAVPVQATPTPTVVQPLPKPIQSAAPIHWTGVALLLWICGIAIGFLRLALNWRRAQRIRRQQIPIVSESVSAIVNRLCIQLKIAHPPVIALSDSRVGPVLIGLFRPTILLPKSWSVANVPNFREMALAHELAHFRRRDLLWSWLIAFTGVLFFFHPLAWLLCRESAISADAACDAEALAATECDRRSYADLLLDLAANHAGLCTGGFGMLGMSETIGTLKKRLRNLTNARIPSRRMVLIAGIMIAVLAIPGLMNWRLVRRAKADEPVKPTTLPATQSVRASGATSKPLPMSLPEIQDLMKSPPGGGFASTPQARRQFDTKNLRTLLKLERELQLIQFNATPVGDVFGFLKDVTGVDIVVNWNALNRANIDRNAPITLSLSNVPFEKVLQSVLDQAAGGAGKLDYVISEGVIQITTVDDLDDAMVIKVYDTSDLLAKPVAGEDKDKANAEMQNQMEQIVSRVEAVDAETWKSNNPKGRGSINVSNQSLIITQTPKVLKDVDVLLAQLRADATTKPANGPTTESSDAKLIEVETATRRYAITSLMVLALTRQRQKDYEGAIRALDQILKLDPSNISALDKRKVVEEQAKTQEMIELANQRPNSSAPSTRLSDADQAAWKILLMELPRVQFDASNLGEVITFLKDVTGANIQVNWTALKTLNVDKNTEVTLSMSNFLVEKALQLALDQAAGGAGKLKFILRDGIIEISTVDDLKTQSTTKPADEPVRK